ncbi:unnamed protein product [Urochloa decumbens]|uniref:Uncharacterized protein n=1 Tax=Urochloa decumbens TaxID=240449 RepID=A0ABC9E9E0_9POAL
MEKIGGMPKRRDRDSQSQSPACKRSRPAPKKKHLYLVLDDWEKGYSIRKIGPDDTLLPASSGSTCTDLQDLPEPAAFRFAAPANSETIFAALGSNIVIVSSSGDHTTTEAPNPTLVYDTAAAALAVGPPLPGRLVSGLNAAVAGGDAFYALTTLGAGFPVALEAFSWARCTRDADEPGLPTHEWSWKTVAATSPPPFGNDDDTTVVSYAVHPDGRTMFVSTRVAHGGSRRGGGGGSTYSFDTTRGEWRRHGAWVLPFRGQGYFDRELDAWVGLDAEVPGYVCACQVASRSGGGGTASAPPESDRLEDKLFCKGGEEGTTHLGATLTYMGDSRFCLTESVALEDGTGDGYMARVTTFGLKFNRKGKLQIATSHHTANSYVLSKRMSSFYPVAFWM